MNQQKLKPKFKKRIISFKKVDAGALYYAIFITFLISILSGLLILYSFVYNSNIDRQILQEQVLSNVKSGINLILKNPEEINYGSSEEIKLFGNDYDQVRIKKEHWGVYDLIFANSQRHNYKASKIAWVGDHLGKKEDVALYLTDQKKYLSISGSTLLKGTCYLPKLGIKRAYIEGQGYQNRELIYGAIQQSKSSLPSLNADKIKYLENLVSSSILNSDSLVEIASIRSNQPIFNSFYNKPLMLVSDQVSELQGLNISGNVILKFDHDIEIDASCNLNDVIIIAPNVILHSGFIGQIQVLATNRIVVEESCKLKYPSFIGVLKNSEDTEASILINKSSVIAGGVLLYANSNNMKDPLVLKLAESTEIYGLVYCDGYIEHKGNIFGSLYCNGFTLKTAASLYENHLLNATIDYSKLPSDFIGVNLVGKAINEQIIKWVE